MVRVRHKNGHIATYMYIAKMTKVSFFKMTKCRNASWVHGTRREFGSIVVGYLLPMSSEGYKWKLIRLTLVGILLDNQSSCCWCSDSPHCRFISNHVIEYAVYMGLCLLWWWHICCYGWMANFLPLIFDVYSIAPPAGRDLNPREQFAVEVEPKFIVKCFELWGECRSDRTDNLSYCALGSTNILSTTRASSRAPV